MTMNMLLFLLPLGAMLIAVTVDGRTRSGYGLAIFSFLLLACNVLFLALVILAQSDTEQPRSGGRLGLGLVLILYFGGAVFITLFVVGGALIEAGSARHWWWMVGFLAAGVVPVLVIATTALPLPFWKHTNAAYYVQNIGYIGILVVPPATVLAYSITRIARPVAPARQATIPNAPAS
jgi:hypothetical protein